MIVYQSDKTRFIEDVKNDVLAEAVEKTIQSAIGRKTPKSEFDSWRNSAVYMRNAIEDSSIPDDCGVSIEYQIPGSAKRIDYLLTGMDQNGSASVVIVELKQWSSSKKTSMDATVLAFVGGGERPLTHPSYQAWSYAELLKGFNEYVYENDVSLYPCAFLHNYPITNDAIVDPFYRHHLSRAPVFRKSEAAKLSQFISQYVKTGDRGKLLYEIEQGRIRPSKKLADALASLIQGKQEFILIDEQKVIYELILDRIKKSIENTVVIIEGGPGTGKSVVAINLLVSIGAMRKTCHYVSRNSAPREVYQAKLTGTLTKTKFSNLFKSSGAYTNSKKNEFDALIVDEAHRLTEKSGMFRKGENQISELISAAKVSVFFVDGDQRVTTLDIGTADEIQRLAIEQHAEVIRAELPTQFRCGGSDGYLAWIDNTLEIRDTVNKDMRGIEYDFRVYDSPSDMRAEIERLNSQGNVGRILAGYCWDWLSKDNPLAYDIEFPEHDFRIRWNDFELGQSWIMHEESIGQAGCIHTSQGLEVDYVGVIIGNDLAYKNFNLTTNALEHPSRDKNFQGFKRMMRENPHKATELASVLIKNTYRTLLTRGIKGCFIYCTDKELGQYFRRSMG